MRVGGMTGGKNRQYHGGDKKCAAPHKNPPVIPCPGCTGQTTNEPDHIRIVSPRKNISFGKRGRALAVQRV